MDEQIKEKKVCVTELENSDIFDTVFENVMLNKEIYIIYADEDYKKAIAVLKPYI